MIGFNLQKTKRHFTALLAEKFTQREAEQLMRILLEDLFGIDWNQQLMNPDLRIDEHQHYQLDEAVKRLLTGEPVQYVLGEATFCSRTFYVEPGILIPRPETEHLCRLITKHTTDGSPIRTILDIGTGSGCIAITLALDIPNAEVEAWDISLEALTIAHKNANTLNANVTFKEKDIIKCSIAPVLAEQKVSVIVSNPPYIVPSESSAMSDSVLNHEPNIALFTPEDDPLKFYRAISDYAKTALLPQGKLYFEINPLFAQQLEALLKEQGFGDITFKNDQYGKQRFVKAILNK